HRLDSLTLAGGCAMNSVANGKVVRQSPFKRLYVQSAAGDAGGAIGAAIYAWHPSGQSGATATGGNHVPNSSVRAGDTSSGRRIMDHAYLGPTASEQEIMGLLAERETEIRLSRCAVEHVTDRAQLYRQTAEVIALGEVVGWFQGRMEWGPRALGN